MEPSEKEILSWIKEYRSVFRTEYLGTIYFFRRLTRREYRLVQFIEEDTDKSDQVCETCILWPQEFKVLDQMPAGLPDILCGEILRVSGCDSLAEQLKFHINSITTDLEAQMEAVIEYAFKGGGHFENYQDISHSEFFGAYARATWILEQAQNLKFNTEEPKVEQTPTNRTKNKIGEKFDFDNIDPNYDPFSKIAEVDDTRTPPALKPMSKVMAKHEKAMRRQAILRNIKK